MLKLLFATLALFFSVTTQAQVVPIVRPGNPATAIAQYVMPAGSPIFVNRKTMIGKSFGRARADQVIFVSCDTNINSGCYDQNSQTPTYYSGAAYGFDPNGVGGSGDFRIVCKVSHQSFDDPIVWPGHPGITHLHTFVGNTSTGSASILDDMSIAGTSTCAGGMINASGYWFPTPIYHCPAVAIGCDHTRDGEIQQWVVNVNVYYKCGLAGYPPNCTTNGNKYYRCDALPAGNPVAGGPFACLTANNPDTSLRAIRWAPPGYRYIKGNASGRAPPDGEVRYECERTATFIPLGNIPTTAEANAQGGCNNVKLLITLPNCWDGVNLDSPNHSSHAIEANDGTWQCSDPNFPVLIAVPAMNASWVIKDPADLNYVRLSSDPPCADEGGPAGSYTDSTGAPFLCNGKPNNGQPAGFTDHLDWVNGWAHKANFMGLNRGTATDIMMRTCYHRAQPVESNVDCHDNNLGDILGDGRYWQVGPGYSELHGTP